MARSLAELVEDTGIAVTELRGSAATEVSGITLDSRAVQQGDLFCCVPGALVDGHVFAAAALAAGAAALLVERPLDLDVAQIVVADVRSSLGLFAAAIFDHPSRRLTMVGVTGTNGKTTTAALIAAILEAAGMNTAVIGTLTGVHTTPEAPILQAQLAAFAAAGKHAVVMEVSSHALALHRVNGCHFDLAVFTNLGSDHLDLHETPERYFAAKASLFTPERSTQGISNGDDLHGRLLADAASIPMRAYSTAEIDEIDVSTASIAFTWQQRRLRVSLGGSFNVSNALAAATAGDVLGIDIDAIERGLASVGPVAGRFERVASVNGADVLVDFAHTPEGLSIALGAAREVSTSDRVIVVFGAGGDRDRGKRPLMGRAAAEGADVIVVTSDNPRSEDPLAIIRAIVDGIGEDGPADVIVEPDRRAAIAVALRRAQPGDVVVVAGKGHERTQTTGTRVVAFDDRAVVRELAEEEL